MDYAKINLKMLYKIGQYGKIHALYMNIFFRILCYEKGATGAVE